MPGGRHTGGAHRSITDIATGWTINRAVPNKARKWALEAIDHVLARFPFPVLGIDSDNGSESINYHLLAYCEAHKITSARSRSGNKNGGGYVEQNNWSRVREHVGYYRYDTTKTPHQRAVLRTEIRKRPTITMNPAFDRIKPMAVSRQINALTAQLETLALAKKAPRSLPAITEPEHSLSHTT